MKRIKRLLEIIGVTGYEDEIRKYIINEIKNSIDQIEIDNMGNIIACKKGNGKSKKKLMIVAHMDEIGIQITSFSQDGKVRFKTLGSLKTDNLYMNKIMFRNGEVGIVSSDNDIKNVGIKQFESLYIDCGYRSQKEVGNVLEIGEVGTFYNQYYEKNNIIMGKAIDNRVGCYVLIELINKMSNIKDDIYFVFSTQEEFGLKGIKAATSKIQPDLAIGIDTISVENLEDIELGKGVAIKISDSMTICDENLVKQFKQIAYNYKILTQLEVSNVGATELGVIDESSTGVRVVGLSIPIRYGHTAQAIVNKADIKSCSLILEKFFEHM